ncbi:MAG: PhoH family protein [Planctomycetaceae bacterium]
MRATLPIRSPEEIRALLGIQDRHARLFRAEHGITLTVRGGELHIEGGAADVESARLVVEEVMRRYRRSGHVDDAEVELLIRALGGGPTAAASQEGAPGEPILKTRGNGFPVAPRTPTQEAYVQSMRTHEMVFAIGPAGTGKTYLAVAMAVRMMREAVVKKIILTRPAVEAGEKLGFLPGSFEAKVNPYLRPLYDSLADFLDLAQLRKYAESDVIEVAPLAYMRGRTLSHAFVILDEAQNTTPEQMKMFLTRMGHDSRVVVTGDVTQIDLPRTARSGLVHAARVLEGVPGIAFSHFRKEDIIRHPVVQRVVDAYEREDHRSE